MTDRRAIIIGSWSKGRDRPKPQRINAIINRWRKIFEDDRYGYRSLARPSDMPGLFVNPKRADLVEHIDEARKVTSSTEVLIHFVGHSANRGTGDLSLNLGTGEDDTDKSASLSNLLQDLRDKGVERIICILDTCHAGRARMQFSDLRHKAYAMCATGDGYAFDAAFSDELLKAFERPIRKRDQRIDRKKEGITYAKIFQEAKGKLVLANLGNATPESYGDAGDVVVFPVPRTIQKGYVLSASTRTIYGRVSLILAELNRTDRSPSELSKRLRAHPAFVLKKEAGAGGRSVSAQRIADYVDFLRAVQWLVAPGKVLTLTKEGRAAADPSEFNQRLLAAIERHILPEGLSLERLDEIVLGLLEDMIPASPIHIRDRASMLGLRIELSAATRIALALLPTTGRYMKGSADAIFPSDLVG